MAKAATGTAGAVLAMLLVAGNPAGAFDGGRMDGAGPDAWLVGDALLAASPAHAAQRARLADARAALAAFEGATPPAPATRPLAGALAELAAARGGGAALGDRLDDVALRAARVPGLAGALAAVVEAFLAFDDAARADAARRDPAALAVLRATLDDPFAALAAGPAPAAPDAGVAAARVHLLAAAGDLARVLVDTPAEDRAGLVLGAAPALALDLEGAPSVWTEDVALLVDAGGDDLYLNNAGGAGSAHPGVACLVPGQPDHGARGAAALFDLAGDDRYASGRSCGLNGGGYLGAGLLLDAAGDDAYLAGAAGTNGGSVLGSGALLDLGGDDTYVARADLGGGVSAGAGGNGGAAEGDGLLLDAGGRDTYAAGALAVNGGGVLGAGALVDLGDGADRYEADGLPDPALGSATIAGNGGALLGAGLLLDAGGDDAYRGASVGVNGGALGGAGALLDLAGSDRYDAGGMGTNGGVIAGAGLLADLAGDDAYAAGDWAVNGAGDTLVGCVLTPCLVPYPIPAVALLLDAGGRDRYADANGTAEDQSIAPHGEFGARLDLPLQGPLTMRAEGGPLLAAGTPMGSFGMVQCAPVPNGCVYLYLGPFGEDETGAPVVCARGRCQAPLGGEPFPGLGPLRADLAWHGLHGGLDPAGGSEAHSGAAAGVVAGPVAQRVDAPVDAAV